MQRRRRRPSACSCIPSAELNCVLPGRPRRARARASGSTTRSRSSRGERLDLEETAAWITRARRRRLSRPPVLDRRHARARSSCRTPSRDRGLQRRLRARDRARALGRALGRAARGGPDVLRARDRRLPPSGLRLRTSRGPGCARERTAAGVLGGPPRRAASTAPTGPAHHSGVDDGRRLGRGRAATRAAASRSSSASRAAPPSTPAASATATAARSSRRRRTGSITAARLDLPETAPVRTGRGDGRARRQGLDEPAMAVGALARGGSGRARAGAVRPPRHRRRDHRSRASRTRRRGPGLRVALVDRGDFGGATSSASSKLIHGGLRYLRLGDVKLVREAHTERRALLRVVAPHLVRRIPFLFPVYRGGPYRPATIQAGLWTYSTLAGEKLGGLVEPERARRSVPGLRARGPARLRRLPGRLDARRPALPRERDGGGRGGRDRPQLRRGRRPPHSSAAGSRAPRCATGSPARSSRSRPAPSSMRLGRGSTTCAGSRMPGVDAVRPTVEGRPRDAPARRAVVGRAHDPARPGARHVRVPVGGNAAPRHDRHAVRGRPGATSRRPTTTSTSVLGEAAVAVDARVAPQGARPLDLRRPARAAAQRRLDRRRPPRDRLPHRAEAGMLTVAGGKLTTYRRIALDALDAPLGRARALRRRPPPRAAARCDRCRQRRRAARHRLAASSPAVAAHLAHFYGSRADRVVGPRDANGPSCSSGSIPTLPTSPPRSSSPRGRSGRRAPTTSSTAGRRLAARGLATPAVVARVIEAARTAREQAQPRRRPGAPHSDWIGHARDTKES